MNSRFRYVWMLVLVLAAGSQWECRKVENESAKNSAAALSSDLVVKTVRVARRDWISRAPITGTLRSLSTVDVKPEVGGRLIATYFIEGDRVGKNQLLAEIDPTNYRLSIDQAEASLPQVKRPSKNEAAFLSLKKVS